MNRHPAHILLLKAARALELLIAAVILLVIVCGAVFLFRETGRTLLLSPEAFALGDFLSGTLLLVMGIEFVKMLALHTADAVVDVLLFTIVRQMIVSHTDAAETLLGRGSGGGHLRCEEISSGQENAVSCTDRTASRPVRFFRLCPAACSRLRRRASASRAPAQPAAAPTRMPPSTSVGQWTYRYSREKAIPAASTRAGFHRGLPEARRANTAAKDAAVCPEGKDASAGGAVSSSTAVFTKKGRIRPTRGFRTILQQIRSRISAKDRDIPVQRCFRRSSSTAASRSKSLRGRRSG